MKAKWLLSATLFLVTCSDLYIFTRGSADGHCTSKDCQDPSMGQVAGLLKDGLDGKVKLPHLINFPDYNRPQQTINIIERIAGTGDYHQFGIHLLVDNDGSQMRVLEQDNPNDSVGIVRETLRKWIQGKSGLTPATWKTLIKCLRDKILNTLADDIEKFFMYASPTKYVSSPDLDSPSLHSPVKKQLYQLKQNGLDGIVTMATLQSFPSPLPSGADINIIREVTGSGVYKKFGTILLHDIHGTEMRILANKFFGDSMRIVAEVFELWTQGMNGLHPRTWRTLVRCLREVELDTLADDIDDFFPIIEDKFVIPDQSPSSCATCLCWCVPSLWKNRDDKRFTTVCNLLQQAKILVDKISKSNVEGAEVKLDIVVYELDRLTKRLLNQNVRAGIVGLTKVGKSTFLNALLGRSFLPSSVQPQTANETIIVHDLSKPEGELHCIVDRTSSRLATGQQEISQKLLEFNEEVRRNGETTQKCDKLVLYAPIKFLTSGENEDIKLELSDTPGFGEAAAEKIAASVDIAVKDLCAFMLILNSQFLKSESEQKLLKKLSNYHPELFSELNRVLILVNGHENVYKDKKLAISKSASVTPEEVPTYISEYFKKPDFLSFEIPPDKIILFNALWALRSREWRSVSILKQGPNKAKTLYTEALQMLRYIEKYDEADKLERNMTDENINTTLFLLESFSQIEKIENLLRNMVVENGGLILLESSVDDTVSVLNRALLPTITELMENEKVKLKTAEVQSATEIDKVFNGLVADGEARCDSLYSSTDQTHDNLCTTLQESLSNIVSSKSDRYNKVGQHSDKDKTILEMSEVCNSISGAASTKIENQWMILSNATQSTLADQLSRAFSHLNASFLTSLNKICTGERDSESCYLTKDLLSTVPSHLTAVIDSSAHFVNSLAVDLGEPVVLDFVAVQDDALETYIRVTTKIVYATVETEECSGWLWRSCTKKIRIASRDQMVYSPNVTAIKIAIDDAVESWTKLCDENVRDYRKNISISTKDACKSKLKSILEEPHGRVVKMLEASQKALEKAQRNATFLKKTKQELKKLSKVLRDSMRK